MRTEEAIVLVGGRGTRLSSIVNDVPKPLAPVAGRPFLSWILDHLDGAGIRRCILATGYLSAMVERSVGRRWRNMDVDYSVEPSPLGTGGAIAQAATHLYGDSAHVLNGDTFLRYIPGLLEERTLDASADFGIALAFVEDVSRYGAVIVSDGCVTEFREKGAKGRGFINAGSYYLSREAIGKLSLPTPFSFESEVLAPQSTIGGIAAFTETSDFIDIGIPEDYLRAQIIFSDRV